MIIELKNGEIKSVWSNDLETDGTVHAFPIDLHFTYDVEFDLPEMYKKEEIKHYWKTYQDYRSYKNAIKTIKNTTCEQDIIDNIEIMTGSTPHSI